MPKSKIKSAIKNIAIASTLSIVTIANAQAAQGTVASHRSVNSTVEAIGIDMTMGSEGVVLVEMGAVSPDSECASQYPKIDIANVGIDAARMMMDVLLTAKLSNRNAQVYTAYCINGHPSIIRVSTD